MFVLKDKIFGLFGTREAVDDFNKVDNKGFLQRFNELLAEDLDQTELALLQAIFDNLINPETILEKFINERSMDTGLDMFFFSDEAALRRKILKFIQKLYDVKGTNKGYETLFRMVGVDGTIDINVFDNEHGFDNPNLTLDHETRVFDMSKGYCCYRYTIELLGTTAMSNDFIRALQNVVVFNEPINAYLKWIKYNGVEFSINSLGSFNQSFSVSFNV